MSAYLIINKCSEKKLVNSYSDLNAHTLTGTVQIIEIHRSHSCRLGTLTFTVTIYILFTYIVK